MSSKGYTLGRLFAQLEAKGVVRLTDYEVASATPTPIIVPAFTKLSKQGDMDAINETMNELPMDAFAASPLSAEDQAAFPLGYWHEKAKIVRALEEEEPERGSYDDVLMIRIDAPLKQWVLEQGGSKFVRVLLRAERAKQA